jgi:hypothetical protein
LVQQLIRKGREKSFICRQISGTSESFMHRAQWSCGECYNFWLAQAGWPQSHSSVVSPFAASQYAEQYFWPAGAMQRQPSIAHFFASAIVFLPCYFHSDA